MSLLHDLLDSAAERWPERAALSHDGTVVRFAEMREATVRLASWLYSAGVGRGDRVVITAPSGPVIPALAIAAARVGAAFSVVHEQVRGIGLEHVLDDCEPSLVAAGDSAALETARARDILAVSVDELGGHAFPEPGVEVPPAVLPPVSGPLAVDPVCLIYTSGTTSLPKAVVSTHQQVVFSARAIQNVLGYRDDDVVYCPLPLSFDYGLYQLFLGVLSGAHVVLGTAADAGPTLLRRLLDSEATVLPAVPSLAESVAWLLRRSSTRRPALRLITTTGAAMPGKVADALRAAVPGLQVQIMFGLTECKRATIMPPNGDVERPESCGLPLPGTEILVLDEEGRRLPTGNTGEIAVRGPNVMSGYWRRPELTEQRFPRRDGLLPELRTGDYGHLDEDGYLYFSGRRDDLYKERGFRVSATEVEAAAHRVAGVDSAAVLPPDGKRHALLVIVGEKSGEEILAEMREQIEAFKIPRRCLVVDSLPLSGNGKIDRKALAAVVEDRSSTGFAGAPS